MKINQKFNIEHGTQYDRFIWTALVAFLSSTMILPNIKVFSELRFIYVMKQLSLFLFILYIFYKDGYKSFFSKSNYLSFIIILVSFPNLINSLDFLLSLKNILMSMVLVVTAYCFKRMHFENYKRMLEVMLLIIVILITIPALIKTRDTSLFYGMERVRFIGHSTNPNVLGRFSLLGSLLVLRLWKYHTKFINRLVLFFMLFANIYILFLTNSRASLLVLIIVSILSLFHFFFSFLSNIPNGKIIFIATTFTIGTTILVLLLLKLNTNELVKLTTGRTTLWIEMFKDLSLKEILVGSGSTGIGRESHNGYLELFKYFGLLGVLAWTPLFIFLVTCKYKVSVLRNDILGFLVVLGFLFFYLVEGSMFSIGNIVSIYFWIELTQFHFRASH